VLASPLGSVLLAASAQGLVWIGFTGGPGARRPARAWRHAPGRLAAARRQLDAYFAGRRRRFDLPLALAGTPFQLRVWRALLKIPYATTITYTELARRAGRPAAIRAAGAANGRNPLSIVVPCHRVIGRDGALTGYGGGLAVKAALLDLERTGRRRSPRA
jgi:methylated-DNA-[protein]-cysteine S-methyltransferase